MIMSHFDYDRDTNLSGSNINLHDTIIPKAIEWFPLSLEWIITLLILLSLAFYLGIKWYQNYQANFYRREAIIQWQQILAGKDNIKKIQELLELMKQVGVVYFGDETVASLSGDAWWEFVENHSKVIADRKIREVTHRILYQSDTKATGREMMYIAKATRKWIETHNRGEKNA